MTEDDRMTPARAVRLIVRLIAAGEWEHARSTLHYARIWRVSRRTVRVWHQEALRVVAQRADDGR